MAIMPDPHRRSPEVVLIWGGGGHSTELELMLKPCLEWASVMQEFYLTNVFGELQQGTLLGESTLSQFNVLGTRELWLRSPRAVLESPFISLFRTLRSAYTALQVAHVLTSSSPGPGATSRSAGRCDKSHNGDLILFSTGPGVSLVLFVAVRLITWIYHVHCLVSSFPLQFFPMIAVMWLNRSFPSRSEKVPSSTLSANHHPKETTHSTQRPEDPNTSEARPGEPCECFEAIRRVRMIHIETLTRGHDGGVSLSGALIRPLADLAVIQWPKWEKTRPNDFATRIDQWIDHIFKPQTQWSFMPWLVIDAALAELQS